MTSPRLVAGLAFVTVIAQHFTLFYAGSYPVTLGFVTGTALIFLSAPRLSWRLLSAVWSPLIAISALAFVAAAPIGIGADYFSTLALAMVVSASLTAGYSGLSSNLWSSDTLWRSLRLALATVVALSAIQVLTGHFGIKFFFNPFRGSQYLHEYEPYLQFNSLPRAAGFFLEPSYDAFVIGALSVALLARHYRTKSVLVMAFVGMAATQSATGLLLLLGIALLMAIRSKPSSALPLVGGGALLLAFLGPYLQTRVESITRTGSSANYRLVEPLQILRDVLLQHPLGMPLGSIYDVVSKYGLQMDGSEATISLDNGVYVIVYYFGWLGLVLLLFFVAWALRTFVRRRSDPEHPLAWIVPIWLLASLLFSGGIVAPEFGIMTWLTFATYRQIQIGKKDGNEQSSAAIDHHSHVQGSSRTETNVVVTPGTYRLADGRGGSSRYRRRNRSRYR